VDGFPILMHTALDATDCRVLAEFYRQFLGLRYQPGDETPDDDAADDADWLVLLDANGHRVMAVNQVATLARPTWPTDEVPKQMHQEFLVPDSAELERHCRRRAAGEVRREVAVSDRDEPPCS
jgi:catechol-2,3-dioxygenase